MRVYASIAYSFSCLITGKRDFKKDTISCQWVNLYLMDESNIDHIFNGPPMVSHLSTTNL
jgi:hypothetical protein